MSAITDLQAAVTRIAGDIRDAVAKLTAPNATDAEAEAAATALNSAADQLEAVVTPPPAQPA